MTERILLVDDDDELRALIGEYLEQDGFDVVHAPDGRQALVELQKPDVDAVVLDIMMPGMSGMEVLKTLRRDSMIPVIMLTARGDEMDRIIGLELGADDYLPKPCNPRELVARLRAVLRRSGSEVPATLRNGDLELQPGRRRLLRDGVPVTLTSTEFSLMEKLMATPGNVVSRKELYRAALGRDPVRFDRSIDMHMSNLRRKLGRLPGGAERIETIRGVGYLLTVEMGAEE